jgi:AcrR family transcriptional regulator
VMNSSNVRRVTTRVKRSKPGRPTRQQRAAATRQRITQAAYALFCERGYAATAMADVAAAAGVAVQTVYFVFGTKRNLLSRTYEFAVTGGGQGDPLPPPSQAWYAAMRAETVVVEAVRHLVRGVGEIVRRVSPLEAAIRAGMSSDADIARVRALHERLRRDGYRDIAGLLGEKAHLRDGVSEERATQLLLLYLGTDVYRVVTVEFGWRHDEWVDWTVRTLAEQLFGQSAASDA